MKGKIKFFNFDKGWGFITCEDDEDVFFHVSDFLNPGDFHGLEKDDEVEFKLDDAKRGGKKAIKIRKLHSAIESEI